MGPVGLVNVLAVQRIHYVLPEQAPLSLVDDGRRDILQRPDFHFAFPETHGSQTQLRALERNRVVLGMLRIEVDFLDHGNQPIRLPQHERFALLVGQVRDVLIAEDVDVQGDRVVVRRVIDNRSRSRL